MPEQRELILTFLAAALIVALAMGMMHERHYKERRWKHLDARLRVIETMYLEDRGS